MFSLAPPGPPGGDWTQALVHNVPASSEPGLLTQGKEGRLYGVTFAAYPPGVAGTAYVLKAPAAPGGAWTATVLHTFASTEDGVVPEGLTIGAGGVRSGATDGGGSRHHGTVFALTE